MKKWNRTLGIVSRAFCLFVDGKFVGQKCEIIAGLR